MIGARQRLGGLSHLRGGIDDPGPVAGSELRGVGIALIVLRLVADIPDDLCLHRYGVLHDVVDVRGRGGYVRTDRLWGVDANEVIR